MANVDFTTGTEFDPDGDLTVTSTTITVATMNAASSGETGVRFPVSLAGNFRFRFGPINLTSPSSNNSRISLLIASNAAGGGDSINEAHPAIQVRWVNTTTNPTLSLDYFNSSANLSESPTLTDTYQGAAVAASTSFYLDIERAGTAMTAKLYSDAYSTLVDTLAITLTATDTINYVYAAGRYAIGGGATIDGTLQNLDLTYSGGAEIALSADASAEATATGAITQPRLITNPLRDIDSGVLKSATYATVHAYLSSDRSSIAASWTNKTPDGAGKLTLNHASLQAIGTSYDVVGWSSDGSDRFHDTVLVTDQGA